VVLVLLGALVHLVEEEEVEEVVELKKKQYFE
jgi:hypothetical protein